MQIVQSGKAFMARNVATPVVVSSALGALAAGVVISVALNSKIKPLEKAAKMAKGNK